MEATILSLYEAMGWSGMRAKVALDVCAESSGTKETIGKVSGSASDTRTRLVKAASQTHNLVSAFVEGHYKPDNNVNSTA